MWVATEQRVSKKIKNCIADQNIKTKQELIFLVWCTLIHDYFMYITQSIHSFTCQQQISSLHLMFNSKKPESVSVSP